VVLPPPPPPPPPQYNLHRGSGEGGDHRLHARVGAAGGEGQERTPVCGEFRERSEIQVSSKKKT